MSLVYPFAERESAGAQMTNMHHEHGDPMTSHRRDEHRPAIITAVVGAVGWVVDHLYHSGNPQVRSYYKSDPLASRQASPSAKVE